MRRLAIGALLLALSDCGGSSKPPEAAERRCTAGENLQLCGKNLVFAHRGGKSLWPEETMMAFENAAKAGVDVLELDVHASKDGVVVCIHDDKLDRTTNGAGLVRDKTFAELQALDAAYKFPTEEAKTFPLRGTGVKLATLKEVLEKFPNMPFSIEIKQSQPSIVDAVISVIEAAKMSDKVVIASFFDDTIREVRTKRPNLATTLALGEMTKILTLKEEDLGGYTLPAPIFQANAANITGENMPLFNKLGVRVHVWTVNDEDTMRRMWKLGVHGIMSDDPALLLKVTSDLGRTDKGL